MPGLLRKWSVDGLHEPLTSVADVLITLTRYTGLHSSLVLWRVRVLSGRWCYDISTCLWNRIVKRDITIPMQRTESGGKVGM